MAPGSSPNTQRALYWKLAGWYQNGGLSKKSAPCTSSRLNCAYSKKGGTFIRHCEKLTWSPVLCVTAPLDTDLCAMTCTLVELLVRTISDILATPTNNFIDAPCVQTPYSRWMIRAGRRSFEGHVSDIIAHCDP